MRLSATGAAGVAPSTPIVITFSEAMNPFTVTAQTFTLWQNGAIPVAGSVVYIGPTAFFKPAGNLSANSAYTAEIAGEAGGAPAGFPQREELRPRLPELGRRGAHGVQVRRQEHPMLQHCRTSLVAAA